MGSPNAKAYLASPAVVAASAVQGRICGPENLDPALLPSADALKYSIELGQRHSSSGSAAASTSTSTEGKAASSADAQDLLPGFPPTFSGSLVFAPQDNLNTDGIYPGKYTYQDDITAERQAEVVMENYDPAFAARVAELRQAAAIAAISDTTQGKVGTILVSGYNFGTGSSREQAATALKHAGVPLVLAGSFGDIFKRNAINNGLVCLECPELVEDLTRQYARDGARGNGGKEEGEISVFLKGARVSLDSSNGQLTLHTRDGETKRYTTTPAGVGTAVQDIWTAGGLEAWVKRTIGA